MSDLQAANELMTVEQVAEYLDVSERTIRTYITNKELKATKIGRYWKISKKDIQTFLDSRSNMREDNSHE